MLFEFHPFNSVKEKNGADFLEGQKKRKKATLN